MEIAGTSLPEEETQSTGCTGCACLGCLGPVRRPVWSGEVKSREWEEMKLECIGIGWCRTLTLPK
jgi:hypothetical protein